MGRAVCYSDIAARINSPKGLARRRRGGWKNPISFVGPAIARSAKAAR